MPSHFLPRTRRPPLRPGFTRSRPTHPTTPKTKTTMIPTQTLTTTKTNPIRSSWNVAGLCGPAVVRLSQFLIVVSSCLGFDESLANQQTQRQPRQSKPMMDMIVVIPIRRRDPNADWLGVAAMVAVEHLPSDNMPWNKGTSLECDVDWSPRRRYWIPLPPTSYYPLSPDIDYMGCGRSCVRFALRTHALSQWLFRPL